MHELFDFALRQGVEWRMSSLWPTGAGRLVSAAVTAAVLSCGTTEHVIGRDPDAAGAEVGTGGGTGKDSPKLAVQGPAFVLDGLPFDMWGIRVASATMSAALTAHLIAQLDDYLAYGVNTITVFYQGSNGGNHDPFTADGVAVDPEHAARMRSVVEAAAQRGMVVIVGIFYHIPDIGRVNIESWTASVEAVRTVTREMLPYRNVIINVANQNSSSEHDGLPWANVKSPEGAGEMFRAVHAIDPTRIVGTGSVGLGANVEIAKLPDADVLLFSGGGLEARMIEFRNAGLGDQPIVCVELYGSKSDVYLPAGVFADNIKQQYIDDANAAAADPGLSVFFQATPWTQGIGSAGLHFDLAGAGTIGDPGIRWYFEHVASLTQRSSQN
ncbi:MAG: hypothetical protein RJA70_1990 [Pseudomonadota bacterium]|jgi:hypothetical protein